MQTPKARSSSSEVPQKVSPRASRSLEVPQKISPRAASSEGPQKVSPRVVRQLKTTGLDSETISSANRASRIPADKSPKVSERRSPRAPPTSEKLRPSRVVELESQISQLERDLKTVKDQLTSTEARKQQAEQDAEESKKQLLALSVELEDSQKQILKQSAFEESEIIETQKFSEQQDQKILFELEKSVESAALTSVVNEIKDLRVQIDKVAESEATQTKHAELAQSELHNLKEKLTETLVLMEDVKEQLRDCKESEAHAQALVAETLMQLEIAKRTVEALQSDGFKSMEAYNTIASELEQSKARVNLLEELVSKLDGSKNSEASLDQNLRSVQSEAEQLRSALEAAEIRYNEELSHSSVEIRNAHDLVEQIKSSSSQREAELEMNVKKLTVEIEELKANLMDKETELQGISEENEFLNRRLKNVLSGQSEYDLEKELETSKADIENLKASLMDKETNLQIISEENETLKLEVKKNEFNGANVKDEVVAEVEAAKAAEREALMKVGYMTEEVDKSNRKATRIAEQLEAAQAVTSDLEAELRRLKVQADQWRKAAEAAASILSSGNNNNNNNNNNNGKFMERTGSMDSRYSPKSGKTNLSYGEDVEDDMMKKKNANMLKKFGGVLWKKPQK